MTLQLGGVVVFLTPHVAIAERRISRSIRTNDKNWNSHSKNKVNLNMTFGLLGVGSARCIT